MVGTLSQSDYGWGPSANQITGVHARVVCTGVACTGVMRKSCVHKGCVHKGGGDTQPISGANQGCTHRGCMCRGCVQGLCVQELCAWLHVQGLCTKVARAGVACARVEGTLSQSVEPIRVARTGVAHTGVACKGGGDNQPISGTNQGCLCRGCMHKSCMPRGCPWLPLVTHSNH